MVKLYASLLVLTLATSLALASPYGRIGISQRELDQEFSGREYPLDAAARDTSASDDLEARGLLDVFSFAGKAFKAGKALKSGGQLVEKAKKVYKVAKRVHEVEKQFPSQPTNKNHAQKAQAPSPAFMALFANISQMVARIKSQSIKSASNHHRRGMEDEEELLQRDFDAEELFEREYDDFLVERDAFDDLD